MENQLNELYNKIANHLDFMIPTEWDKIYLLGEVEKGQLSISSTFYFIDSTTKQIVRGYSIPENYNVSEQTCSELQKRLTEMIYELSNCFKDNGQELWERVVFILDNNGKFNINFQYNAINESDGGQLNREIIWAYNTFEYIPKDGTYSRRLLDKYLNTLHMYTPDT